jgi:hypothetical protein
MHSVYPQCELGHNFSLLDLMILALIGCIDAGMASMQYASVRWEAMLEVA